MKKILLIAMAVVAVGTLVVLAQNQDKPNFKHQGSEALGGPGHTNHFGGVRGERAKKMMAWLKETDPQKFQEIKTLREQLHQKMKEAVEAYRAAHPNEKPEGSGAASGAGTPTKGA